MSSCARHFRNQWVIFLGVTVFVSLFSTVYEMFGHGVQSNAMIFAFLYPFLGSVVPLFITLFIRKFKYIPYKSTIRFGINLWYSGIATLTVGSLAYGVVEIYGTTNRLIKVYYILGIPMFGIGFLITVAGVIQGMKELKERMKAD